MTKSNWSKDKNQCLDKISHLLETFVKVHFLGDECLNVHCCPAKKMGVDFCVKCVDRFFVFGALLSKKILIRVDRFLCFAC